MTNCRVNTRGNLVKRCGFKSFYTAPGAIRGCWYGPVMGGEYALYLCSGSKLLRIADDGTETLLGYVTSGRTNRCSLFPFAGRLYILDGAEYYRWDGTSLTAVSGYIPIVSYSPTYNEYGAVWEVPNMLTTSVIKRFINTYAGNTNFWLDKIYPTILWVKVNGVNVSYTVGANTTRGYASVTGGVANGAVVDVCYIDPTLSSASRALVVTNTRAAVYGRTNATHVMLWGRENGRVYPGEYQLGGELSAEYFPVNTSFMVGDGSYPITSMIRQFDGCMTFTSDATWMLTQEEAVSDVGIYSHTYTRVTLNESIGSVGDDSAKQVENEPFSVTRTGIYRWEETEIAGERNARLISAPIADRISAGFSSSVVTLHERDHGEFWVYDSCGLFVYDYRHHIWYSFTGIVPDGFIDLNGEAGFWSGRNIYRFDVSLLRDCGAAYSSVYAYEPSALGDETSMKALDRLYVSLTDGYGEVCPSLISDRGASIDVTPVCADPTSRTTVRRRVKLPRAVYVGLSLENSSGVQCEICGCSLGFRTGGEGKQKI